MLLLLWLSYYLTIVSSMSLSHRFGLHRSINIFNQEDPEIFSDRICRTKYCNEIASSILRNRDISVNPCDDFYQHACGLWEKNHPIPDTELEWSQDLIITKRINELIRDLLAEEGKPTDIAPIKLVRRLYRSCMNLDRIERRGINPIQEILDKSGGWPIAMPPDAWNSSQISWQTIDQQYLTLIENSAFYSVGYEINENKTSENILGINQGITSAWNANKRVQNKISNSYYKKHIAGIAHVVKAFAKHKGYELNRENLIEDIYQMLTFQLRLQKIIQNTTEPGDKNTEFKVMTIQELQKWYDSFDAAHAPTSRTNFLEIIRSAFKISDINITGHEQIIVYNPHFFHDLAELLKNTTERVIVNFIQWNMVFTLIPYTNKDMMQIIFDTVASEYNVTHHPQRWEYCVADIAMKDAVSYLFVKKYVHDDVIQKATEMVEIIQKELENLVLKSEWITKDIKRFMKEKLQNLIKQVGYPDWYKNDTILVQQYEGLDIGLDYFQNILNCQQYALKHLLNAFNKTFDRSTWLDYPITVNAFYSDSTNTILIPAAELQDPYFTPNLPESINYGAVGFVIGHELSHCFDNDGMRYDKIGQKVSWSTDELLKSYNERAECFINQFSNYTLDVTDESGVPIQLDGKITQDENIADSSGIQVAFAAYKTAKGGRNDEMKLPGLETISDDQLFFYSFANAWCSLKRSQYEADTVNEDEHSPSKFRIIGSLSNMKTFAQTFKCPPNSSMNQEQKCNLWK